MEEVIVIEIEEICHVLNTGSYPKGKEQVPKGRGTNRWRKFQDMFGIPHQDRDCKMKSRYDDADPIPFLSVA